MALSESFRHREGSHSTTPIGTTSADVASPVVSVTIDQTSLGPRLARPQTRVTATILDDYYADCDHLFSNPADWW